MNWQTDGKQFHEDFKRLTKDFKRLNKNFKRLNGVSNDGGKDLLLYAKKKVIDSPRPELLMKTYKKKVCG